jgi:lipoic acid synthetase
LKATKLPPWLRRPLPAGEALEKTARTFKDLGLETICDGARCPNRGVCWARGTATVLILGDVCTRNCHFCSVKNGKPPAPDPTEPQRVAELTMRLGIRYLVITSVTRDDLPDGGAAAFRDCVEAARQLCPTSGFELLVPDFRHCGTAAVETLARCLPFVFAHNVETVPQLYKTARPGADYEGSLELLRTAAEKLPDTPTKSSIMLGLGESDEQVESVLEDLRSAGCGAITIGQYLRPSPDSLRVAEYVEPAKFDSWRRRAVEMGFDSVLSEPFARSSYLATRPPGGQSR